MIYITYVFPKTSSDFLHQKSAYSFAATAKENNCKLISRDTTCKNEEWNNCPAVQSSIQWIGSAMSPEFAIIKQSECNPFRIDLHMPL
jgi:hypothetical protein